MHAQSDFLMGAGFVGLSVRALDEYTTPMDESDPIGGATMATCDTCGNEYDKTFTLTRQNVTGTYDSFECAIHAMAPECAHCRCKILGHGVEAEGVMYCCAHCARKAGHSELADRA